MKSIRSIIRIGLDESLGDSKLDPIDEYSELEFYIRCFLAKVWHCYSDFLPLINDLNCTSK